MADNQEKPSPFVNVAESGKNFTMEDCEFRLNGSDRPILETRAEGTRLLRIKVVSVISKIKERKWLWVFAVPLGVALLVEVVKKLVF